MGVAFPCCVAALSEVVDTFTDNPPPPDDDGTAGGEEEAAAAATREKSFPFFPASAEDRGGEELGGAVDDVDDGGGASLVLDAVDDAVAEEDMRAKSFPFGLLPAIDAALPAAVLVVVEEVRFLDCRRFLEILDCRYV